MTADGAYLSRMPLPLPDGVQARVDAALSGRFRIDQTVAISAERILFRAHDLILSAAEPLISAATFFEMAIKTSVGKLDLPPRWADRLVSEQR